MQECPWESLHLFTQSRRSPFMTAPSKWAACYQFVLDDEALGALLPAATLGCVCVRVCACRAMEKRLTPHCCAVGNRPGTTDTDVPRVSRRAVSHLEINERMFFIKKEEFHLWNGLFVCPRTRTVVKVSEQHLLQETKAGVLLEVEHKGKMKTKRIRQVLRLNWYSNASRTASLPVWVQNIFCCEAQRRKKI